jgi:hypothetical protein
VKRPQYVKTFGTGDNVLTVRITEPAPRKGLRIFARLVEMLGRKVLQIIAAGGVYVQDEDGEKKLVSVLNILQDQDALGLIVAELVEAIGKIGPDKIEELADELLVGNCECMGKNVKGDGTVWADTFYPLSSDPKEAQEQIDDWWPDALAYVGTLKWALESFYRPTSAASSTSDDTSAAETENQPADT